MDRIFRNRFAISYSLMLLFVVGIFFSTTQAYAAFVPEGKKAETAKAVSPSTRQDSYRILAALTNKEIEKLAGRRLTFREKAGLNWLRKQNGRKAEGSFQMPAEWTDKCFNMYLKNGDVLEVKLIQLTPTEIKYKRCNKPDDPEIVIAKEDVFSIKDGSGETIFSSKDESWKKSYQTADGQTDKLALSAGITGLFAVTFGLLFWPVGLAAGIAAGVMGIVSMKRFGSNPKLRGEGWAITGIVAGGLWIFFGILVLIALAAGW